MKTRPVRTVFAVPTLVVHVPHASRTIPRTVRRRFVPTDSELEIELLRMTDHYTDELFACDAGQAGSVVYPVSRLVADPERFESDAAEPMAARGMGLVYTATSHQAVLRHGLGAEERRDLIRDYYRPHHERLRNAVAASLRSHQWCLILDAHSFPSTPLPYESDHARPDYCVGTDAFHTPPWLVRGLMAMLRRGGHTVKLNRPFGGTMVPMRYYERDPRVLSVMIEVNRGLYMNENTGRRSRQFGKVRRHLAAVRENLVDLATRRMLAAR